MRTVNVSASGWERYKNDVLSGITVSLALVPEAVAFSFVAGVNPLVGMFAAIIVGLITSAFGGRPGMISAAAGSLAVVMVSLVAEHGTEYLFAAVILMGVFQVIIGVMKWGRFIRMVPQPVMIGFVNGLAIIIFLAQLKQFKTSDGHWLSGEPLQIMLALVAASMAIIYILPKFTKAIPSALASIILITLAVIFLDIHTVTVGDKAVVSASLETLFFGDPRDPQLNGFHIPMVPFTWETLWIILPYALILTVVGTTESLLTMTLIDDITQTRGQANRECIALGCANVTSGLFSTMGGCALIGQSLINIRSGGLGRLSGITAALMLLLIVLALSDYIAKIPVAALVGLMFVVVIATFDWSSWNIMRGMSKADAAVMILVTVLTVVFDLAVAVVAGVIVSALVFAWQHAQRVMVEAEETEIDGKKVKIYTVYGPLFFASAQNFVDLFDPKNDPDCVKIDFKYSRVYDYTGVEAIDKLTKRYKEQGKKLVLKHLSPECRQLLHDARDLVEVNISEDPHYHVSLGK
ncbi:SulP family inorganic anion transporter [Galenea microaerophila]